MSTSLWKGMVAGAAAGMAASFVMNQFQAGWTRREAGFERGHGAQSAKTESGHDPTTRLAEAVSPRPLSEQEKELAGRAVHYAYGAAMGAAYGALTEAAPATAAGFGSVMGVGLWAASDLGLLPSLGLSRDPEEYEGWVHAQSLASHVVYGTVTEAVRRVIRGG